MRFSILLFIFFSLVCTVVQAQNNDTIKTQNLSEVEISANTKPSVSRSTNLLQVITNDDLLQQGVQSVSDAVKRFNGVVLKDYGGIGGLKTVSIRGMGAEYTAVSYDGVLVSNIQSGQVDIGRFALDNVSMISLDIGQSDDIFQTARAFSSAGVLNMETVVPDFSNKRYAGYAKVTGGSFGLFNPVIDYKYKLSKTFALTANGSWQRADGNYPFSADYDKMIPDRKRKNSDVDIYRTELNLFSDFGKSGQLRTKIYYFDSERGLPGSVVIGEDYATERLWDKNFFAQMSYRKDFGQKIKLKTQAKYDHNNTRYEEVHEKYDGGRLTNRYKEQEVYLSNALLFQLSDIINFSAAEDLSYNNLDKEADRFGNNLANPKRYNSHTALAFRYKSDRLTITSSLLATYISERVKNNSGNSTYKKLSPSTGISYQPVESANLRVRASFKHVYRVPTFTELYYPSVEKKLKAESAKQFNVGLTWVGGFGGNSENYVNASIDGYYNKVDDKIVITPKTFLATTSNVGNVDIKGVNLRLAANSQINKSMGLNLVVTYNYMQAQDVTSKSEETYKNQLPYTPEHSGAVTLSFNNPWVNFSYTMIAASDRYSKLTNYRDNEVKGYTDHSISLFRKLRLKDNELIIQGNVLNLWNENYDVIAYYPMPRRSFSFSVLYKF
ncbi:MAG: TonB-dependent receptor [Prevotella sp.]|jgi:outer membrane cobalamin receptor|nr:TonB-dependent receptor [Prevotella sp.]